MHIVKHLHLRALVQFWDDNSRISSAPAQRLLHCLTTLNDPSVEEHWSVLICYLSVLFPWRLSVVSHHRFVRACQQAQVLRIPADEPYQVQC